MAWYTCGRICPPSPIENLLISLRLVRPLRDARSDASCLAPRPASSCPHNILLLIQKDVPSPRAFSVRAAASPMIGEWGASIRELQLDSE